MYKEHFGLTESPFSIAPDPRYLFLGEAHREALAHLLYGVRGDGGFVLLTGEVGTGKTTICRCLLEQVQEEVQVALVLNPALNVPELLATICDDLGVAYPEGNLSNKIFIDALNRFLLDSHARGRTTVLIVDEAQNLSGEVLEQLRLLTNLETNRRKLLQIILIGQPELRQLLARNDMRQIAQRITARYHLGSLERSAASSYLQHRLAVAGVRRRIFSPAAVTVLYRRSRGIPRLLNVLADRSLLGAYARGRAIVRAGTARRAAAEVIESSVFGGRRWLLASLAAVFAGVIFLTWMAPGGTPGPAAESATGEEGGATVAVSGSPEADRLFALTPGRGGERPAEEALLGLWGVSASGGDLCEDARQEGLACLNGIGSLPLLSRLDRPALLELHSAAGDTSYATLVRLEDETAEMQIDGRAIHLPVENLKQYWLGSFTLLWRPKLPNITTLGRGAAGSAVAWLDKALPGLEDGKEPVSRSYDDRLETRVKQFQVRQGLMPDGIAGPQTLILLNQILGAPGPRLSRSTAEG